MAVGRTGFEERSLAGGVGFIGTGTITTAMVTGLCAADASCGEIWVSPRNEHKAAQLAARFVAVRIGRTNQDVLEHADTVVLAVRPQVAAEVLGALEFQPRHRLVSVIATLSGESIRSLVGPTPSITLAAPLPTVALRVGPTAIYPPDAATAALFARISVPVQVKHATEYAALFACTGLMAGYFELLNTCAQFLERHGVDSSQARDYVGALYHALGTAARSHADRSFETLAAEHMTRGGLNEQCRAELIASGVFECYAASLTQVLERILGAQTRETSR